MNSSENGDFNENYVIENNVHSSSEDDEINGALESGELLPGTDLSGILSQNKWRAKLYQLNS